MAYVNTIKIKCPREVVAEQDFFFFIFILKWREMHVVLLSFVLVRASPFQTYSDCNTAWFEGGESND